MRRHEASDDVELTAFLDGLLDPEARARFEARTAVDPALAEDLRALTGVRDLVAGLSRPTAPSDVSDRVVRALKARTAAVEGRASATLWGPRLRHALRIAAVAAGLLAIASLPVVLSRWMASPARVPVATARDQRPAPPTELVGAGPIPAPAPVPPPAPPALVVVQARPAAELVHAPAPAPEAAAFRKVLGRPGLEKCFLVEDPTDGDPSRRVDWILRDAPRTFENYVRIALPADQNPDLNRPGGAAVYAVVMDDREIERLRQDLAIAFPLGTVEERAPRPEVLTRLADAGRVEVLAGTPVADLVDVPGKAHADRTLDHRDLQLDAGGLLFRIPTDLMESDSNEPEAPAPAEAEAVKPAQATDPNEVDLGSRRPAADDATARRRTSKSLVLVWVVRPALPQATAP